jgi:hypothetical protein
MPISTAVVINTNTASAAAAPVQVSLLAVAGQTNYLCGFSVIGLGATAAAANLPVTISGLAGTILPANGSLTLGLIQVPANSVTTAISPLVMSFQPPIPASAPATAITLNVPIFGAGNTMVIATVWGYTQ